MNLLRRIILSVLLLSIGAIVGVILSQYKYFKLNTEISLSDLFICLLTSFFAVYIAYYIQKALSQSQTLHQLFNEDIKSIVNLTSAIENWLFEGQLPFDEAKKRFRSGTIKLNSIKRIYLSHELCSSNKLDEVISIFSSLKHSMLMPPPIQGYINIDVGARSAMQSQYEEFRVKLVSLMMEK